MAQTSFLFRFDGAPDNADFVTRWCERHGGHPYSGTSMRVGVWTPDILEVMVDGDANRMHLTLIELEATEKRAREHCRQYLPESSRAVFEAFVRYLDTVLDRCRVSTDPRLPALQGLKGILSGKMNVIVRTAGALRGSGELLEVFSLMDQAGGPFLQSAVTHNTLQPTFAFGGVQRLSRDDLDGLRRVVRILHAVLVGRDHSGGTIENFSKRNPLKKVLGGKPARYPELSTLVSPNDHSGATVDCERIVNELGALLTAAGNADPDRIRRWIKDFHPIASGFRKDHAMPEVFEQARKVVANQP